MTTKFKITRGAATRRLLIGLNLVGYFLSAPLNLLGLALSFLSYFLTWPSNMAAKTLHALKLEEEMTHSEFIPGLGNDLAKTLIEAMAKSGIAVVAYEENGSTTEDGKPKLN